MIKYFKGDLLQSDVQVIAHQINCIGVMNGGIAKSIKCMYPKHYKDYKTALNSSKNTKKFLGDVITSKVSENKYIVGLFGEYDIHNKVDTIYPALKQSLERLKLFMKENNLKSVGVPYKIGCGMAHGDWNEVKKLLESVFEEEPNITLEVWKF